MRKQRKSIAWCICTAINKDKMSWIHVDVITWAQTWEQKITVWCGSFTYVTKCERKDQRIIDNKNKKQIVEKMKKKKKAKISKTNASWKAVEFLEKKIQHSLFVHYVFRFVSHSRLLVSISFTLVAHVNSVRYAFCFESWKRIEIVKCNK